MKYKIFSDWHIYLPVYIKQIVKYSRSFRSNTFYKLWGIIFVTSLWFASKLMTKNFSVHKTLHSLCYQKDTLFDDAELEISRCDDTEVYQTCHQSSQKSDEKHDQPSQHLDNHYFLSKKQEGYTT